MARTFFVFLIVVVLVLIVLVWTGFLRVNTQGELRAPQVSATGGEVPTVNVQTKKLVVGSKEETVDVPKVGTEQKVVRVPTIGVQDDNSSAGK